MLQDVALAAKKLEDDLQDHVFDDAFHERDAVGQDLCISAAIALSENSL